MFMGNAGGGVILEVLRRRCLVPVSSPDHCRGFRVSGRGVLKAYLEAVESAFGADIDYAQLQKIYGAPAENHTRYSPAQCIGCHMKVVSGDPDPKHVSTSFVERQNLSMRMSIRRFTRLTNAFAKKIENHAAAVALWFTYYNFCRVHSTLRVTPAMEAGICDHVWNVEELCDLLPENHKIGVETDKTLILKALGEKIG